MTAPLYLIEADFGRLGRAFIETDRDKNSRAHAIELIRSGEVRPVKVLEVFEDEGTCRDVTADILAEIEVDALNCGHAIMSAGELVMNALHQANERQAAAWDHNRKLRAQGDR